MLLEEFLSLVMEMIFSWDTKKQMVVFLPLTSVPKSQHDGLTSSNGVESEGSWNMARL